MHKVKESATLTHLPKHVILLRIKQLCAAAVAVVFNLLDGAKDLVLGLPFSLYGTFVVEQKHGFNKQTLGLFCIDIVKSVSTHLFLRLAYLLQLQASST